MEYRSSNVYTRFNIEYMSFEQTIYNMILKYAID